MQSRQTPDVVPHALLTAVWRRKPKNKALIHSDQRGQFAGMDWTAFRRTTMSDAETRLAELQAEVDHLADMAVHMMVGLCFGLGGTPDGLRKIASDFAAAAEDPDPAISRLAAALQMALREAAEKLEGQTDSA